MTEFEMALEVFDAVVHKLELLASIEGQQSNIAVKFATKESVSKHNYGQFCYTNAAQQVRDMAKEYVESICVKNAYDGWVLCADKLPEEPKEKIESIEDIESAILHGSVKEYNVTLANATRTTTLYYAGDGYWYDETSKELYPVFAWQPLPEPCRGMT